MTLRLSAYRAHGHRSEGGFDHADNPCADRSALRRPDRKTSLSSDQARTIDTSSRSQEFTAGAGAWCRRRAGSS